MTGAGATGDVPPPDEDGAAPPPGHARQAVRGIGLAITNVTKLGGLIVALNESLIRTEVRPVTLAVAAFMMAGAQGLETFLDKLFGR